jgi:hypothetical protein
MQLQNLTPASNEVQRLSTALNESGTVLLYSYACEQGSRIKRADMKFLNSVARYALYDKKNQ